MSSIGAALVVSGVVMKNTSEQLPPETKKDFAFLEYAGMASFLGGWGLTALELGSPLALLASAGVVSSVVKMKMDMKAGRKVMDMEEPMSLIAPAVFSLSWMALGHASGPNVFYKFAIPGLVIASMLGYLPMQRKYSIVDGPGMPMFSLAWFLLILNHKGITL